jgi:hypothetical protein
VSAKIADAYSDQHALEEAFIDGSFQFSSQTGAPQTCSTL